MLTRRNVLAAGCITCWLSAGATFVTNIPRGAELRPVLLTAGVGLLVWLRTEPGADARRIGTVFYARGLHDGIGRAVSPLARQASVSQSWREGP